MRLSTIFACVIIGLASTGWKGNADPADCGVTSCTNVWKNCESNNEYCWYTSATEYSCTSHCDCPTDYGCPAPECASGTTCDNTGVTYFCEADASDPKCTELENAANSLAMCCCMCIFCIVLIFVFLVWLCVKASQPKTVIMQ